MTTEVLDQLILEVAEAEDNDDWDSGYIAGLRRAITLLLADPGEFDQVLVAVQQVYLDEKQ